MKKPDEHTIYIYAWGNFLRIARGTHTYPEVAMKPRCYSSLKEALETEHSPRVLAALKQFPPDAVLRRRARAEKKTIKVARHKALAEAIRSPQFLFAQAGYDRKYQEVAYIYHKCKENSTGLTMVKSAPVGLVKKFLKKYKRKPIRV